MRWWLNTDPPHTFSVDNSAATGMDFFGYPPNLWMVQWTEGKGEIEYQTAEKTNLNGLREAFFDVTPYVPLFQQFMERLIDITLPQAKKIQIDLVKMLYQSKYKLPYHYPVAAGDYWWEAADVSWPAPPSNTVNISDWVPFAMSSAVSLTVVEQNAIINAIVARRNLLYAIRNAKIVEIDALWAFSQVIDYDVLSGWPAAPLPPNYAIWW